MRASLLLLVALLLPTSGCDGARRAADAGDAFPDPIRYAALGDSLATGAGADTSYVAEYAAWLEAKTGSRVVVTNLAVNGWTSQQLLDALRRDTEMRKAVAEAHVVTWDIGGNDLLDALASFLTGGCGGNDGHECIRDAVEESLRNGDALLDEMIELRDGDAAGIRTLDLYLPFVGNPTVAPFLDELRPYLDEFNAQLDERSRSRGVRVADVHRAFHGAEATDPAPPEWIADDGVHPSDQGHEVIARELAALGLELGRLG